MLRPSKKLALALEAVVDIAIQATADPVQSQDIGRRLNLPRRYLEQVMQQLVRAGILKGVRGPRGGYRLARERRRISVADIVQVVRSIAENEDVAAASTSALGRKIMDPFWVATEASFIEQLKGVTIEDLCERAEKLGVVAQPTGTGRASDLDFTI